MQLSEREVKICPPLHFLILVLASFAFKVAVFAHFTTFDSEVAEFVKSFALGRLEDAVMVVESLAILSLLAEKFPLSQQHLTETCIRVLTAVKSRRFGIEPRLAVFTFIRHQCKKLTVSKDLFEAFLNASADEKDPRNLIQIFETVPQLAVSLENEADISELFESVSCYFPITFRATPTDPRLVSVESLKSVLADALSCTPFASETMIFVLAKLASASNAAKLDSLDLLRKAVDTFPRSAFESKAYELKIVLFSEIISNPEPKIQQSALKLLKALCQILPLSCDFHQKFVSEALSAVQLLNHEIISKAAVIIEAVSSANQVSFNFAVDSLLEPLLQLAKSSDSLKAQVSRNCLVALLSPLKSQKSWSNSKLSLVGPALLVNLNISSSDYGVFLVIYSFVSQVIEPSIAHEFISKCLSVLTDLMELSLELKNCLWLASQSHPAVVEPLISQIENASILASIASTCRLAKLVVIRLLQLNHVPALEWIINNSDLADICADSQLVMNLCSFGLSESCLIKLISTAPSNIQATCFTANVPISCLIVACEAAVLESQLSIIKENLSFLLPDAICSLSNKLPSHQVEFAETAAKIASIRGKLWRSDSSALDELKTLVMTAEPALLATIESTSSPDFTSSSLTHHTKKPLWAQKFALNWLPFCCSLIEGRQAASAVLFSVLSVAPQVASALPKDSLLSLLTDFLQWSGEAGIALEVRSASWDLFGTLLFTSLLPLPDVIDLCLANSSQSKEKACLIRMKALQILCKLVEDSQTRLSCRAHQKRVCLTLKKNVLSDAKRVVRREAAKCHNLWLVLEEEGVFE